MDLYLNQTLLTFLLCVRGYLPLIRKNSSTHMCGLAVYVKEGLSIALDLSLENSPDSSHNLDVFDWLYLTQFLTSFSSIDHLLLEILTSIIRTGSLILVERIDLVNSVIIFLSQMTLLRWLTFLLGS